MCQVNYEMGDVQMKIAEEGIRLIRSILDMHKADNQSEHFYVYLCNVMTRLVSVSPFIVL